MYIFLEKDTIINGEKIILIIDYIHITNEENKGFYEKQLAEKRLVDLAEKNKKSVIGTDDRI